VHLGVLGSAVLLIVVYKLKVDLRLV